MSQTDETRVIFRNCLFMLAFGRILLFLYSLIGIANYHSIVKEDKSGRKTSDQNLEVNWLKQQEKKANKLLLRIKVVITIRIKKVEITDLPGLLFLLNKKVL